MPGIKACIFTLEACDFLFFFRLIPLYPVNAFRAHAETVYTYIDYLWPVLYNELY